MSAPAALPPLYEAWLRALLGRDVPSELRATCRSCVMIAPPGEAAADGRVFFHPLARCCTFMPSLPNFTVADFFP